MTANTRQPLAVFIGGSLALALVTGLGVLFGGALLEVIPEAVIRKVAAAAFVVIGVLMFAGKM
jgi:putative Ca2+/H+ antiporter (TMEM165/GDT1 family)